MISKGAASRRRRRAGCTSARAVPDSHADSLLGRSESSDTLGRRPNLAKVRRAAFAMAEEFTVESDAGGEDSNRQTRASATTDERRRADLPGCAHDRRLISHPRRDAAVDRYEQRDRTTEDYRALSENQLDNPDRRDASKHAGRPTGAPELYYAVQARRAKGRVWTLELNDTSLAAEYASFEADTTGWQVRIRPTAEFIETASTADLYHYLQLDDLRQGRGFGWKRSKSANRAFKGVDRKHVRPDAGRRLRCLRRTCARRSKEFYEYLSSATDRVLHRAARRRRERDHIRPKMNMGPKKEPCAGRGVRCATATARWL